MKFMCLGYMEAGMFEAMSETERNGLIDRCFAHDDVLRKNGHFAGGEALVSKAVTLRYRNGKVSAIDGPYAETKDVLGGVLILDARDLDHAIELMSKHPGVRGGPFEIRPIADMTPLIRESEKRRTAPK
jgi:hypothetical protein